MPTEISIIDLILRASFFVQLIMLTLVLMSIFSWAMIIQRRKAINSATELRLKSLKINFGLEQI